MLQARKKKGVGWYVDQLSIQVSIKKIITCAVLVISSVDCASGSWISVRLSEAAVSGDADCGSKHVEAVILISFAAF